MSLPDRTDPDPDPEPGPGAGGVRLCGYRHCRAPLPVVAGRGNRARYCQDGKTWGAQELSCKAAEAAYLAVESLQPEDPALTPTAASRRSPSASTAAGVRAGSSGCSDSTAR